MSATTVCPTLLLLGDDPTEISLRYTASGGAVVEIARALELHMGDASPEVLHRLIELLTEVAGRAETRAFAESRATAASKGVAA